MTKHTKEYGVSGGCLVVLILFAVVLTLAMVLPVVYA